MSRERRLIDRAVKYLRRKVGKPDVAVILGSGMSRVLPARGTVIPFSRIPGFPRPTVDGHAGVLTGGRGVLVLRGRVHLYEGHSAAEVARPARVMARLGARVLIVTNAAGAVNPAYKPGDLMILRDHLNLTGANPLEGVNLKELGPRFPDLSRAYDSALSDEAKKLAGRGARRGVYAALRGPSYETPAEVRMLRKLGADAVGMSTVPEVIAAVHAGMRVVGISCITNPAAGLSCSPLKHDDVIAVTRKTEEKLAKVVDGVVRGVKSGKIRG